jgi:hypothetical protein
MGSPNTLTQENLNPSEAYRESVLSEHSQSSLAFDLLAKNINSELEYPTLLIQNSIQGQSQLDLYFDHEGEVDEKRSRFLGGPRAIRGLLVLAARKGLKHWYQGISALSLSKGQFKNQHFRANFELSYELNTLHKLRKEHDGNYQFVRRENINPCVNTFLDLACMASKAYGALQKATSDEYKIKYLNLLDRLDAYDQLGLKNYKNTI